MNALDQWIRESYSWSGREPNTLYARRNGRFYDFSGVSGIDFTDDSRAFSAIDFDGDGVLDLILKSRLGPQVRVLRNDWGATRGSIVIRLRGTRSNRDAIGARVEVYRPDGVSTQTLHAGSGFLSQHTKDLHFGLGGSDSARQVRIQWPSGLAQDFENLSAGFRYEITEGSSEWKAIAFVQRGPQSKASSPTVVGDNSLGFEATWLLEPVRLPEKRLGPGFVCITGSENVVSPPGVPFEMVNLTKEKPEIAAFYALFRRYLFDYRTGLTLPLLLLVDAQGFVHKVYPEVPNAAILRADLERMNHPDRASVALPFGGTYYALPHRNHYRMGAAFYWAGYPDQSLVYFEDALRYDADNPRTHLAVGHVHLEMGRYKEARQHLERTLELNPESGDGWNALGGLEMLRQDYAAAIRCFDKALQFIPDSSYALVSQGRAHAKLNDTGTAEKLLRHALDLDERNAEAANQLGLVLAASNRRDEARRYFQQAISAQRDHSGAINNLGVLYMELQKPDDAIAAFRYGFEVAPDDETIYMNLARVYVRQGDRTKARQVLQLLQAHKPDSAMARRALDELDKRN